MAKQIARVNWRRGQYSDVFRSTILDQSPLKQGQKVRVIWGKANKEYSAIITCYPLLSESENEDPVQPVEPEQQRRAKAKRKLVSNFQSLFTVDSR